MRLRNGVYHLMTSAVSDFKRSKIRTFLTSLGIMIGVFSVVMLIALGLGLKNYIEGQFESLGANLVIIFPGMVFSEEGGLGGNFGPGFAGGAHFKERDVSALDKVSEIDYVVPMFFKSMVLSANGEEILGYVTGTNEEMFTVSNIELLEGELFSRSDNQRRRKVAVLGYSAAQELFSDPRVALGKRVTASDQRFTVIGVAKKKGDREMDNSLFVPYRSTFGTINPDKTFFAIYLGITSKDAVETAKQRAEETLLKYYEEDDFSVTEQSEILSTINQIFTIINVILVAIGSISLLVGGIGIMNIMYAPVTERTKEVGIRRAIGATQKDILLQFLTEAVTLSVMGGVLGLVLAGVMVLVVRQFFPVALNLLAVVLAFGVSSAIGIFFGVFPARRAASLPPIEAIRYE